MNYLAIPPPLNPQQPAYDKYITAWIGDGEKVAYEKYIFWNKFEINRLPLGVYSVSKFRYCSNKYELWGGYLPDFGNKWIRMVQGNILVTVCNIISFLPKKLSPSITSLTSLIITKNLTGSTPSSLKAALNITSEYHQKWLYRYTE